MEIFDVSGGELGDSVMAERKREARIVNPSAGEAGLGGPGPGGFHQAAGIVEEFPVRVLAQTLHGFDRGGCAEGASEQDFVTEQTVELDEAKLAEGEIGIGLVGGEPGGRSPVLRVPEVEPREEEMGVGRDHDFFPRRRRGM